MPRSRQYATLIMTIALSATCSAPAIHEKVVCSEGQRSFPILLVHGLTGGEDTWVRSGLIGTLEAEGLSYGGKPGQIDDGPADVYAFEVTAQGRRDLDQWARELGKAIDWVRETTGSPRVILLAHSAGGLAARAHLVRRPSDHGVMLLVTISTPHRGSPLAKLAGLKEAIQDGLLPWPLSGWGNAWLGTLADLERAWGVRFDDPIISQLLPEEENPWLAALNGAPHPADVAYRFVVVENEPLTDVLRRLDPLWDGWGEGHRRAIYLELMNTLMGYLEGTSYTQGDGVVPQDRQAPGPLRALGQEPLNRTDTVIPATDHSVLVGDYRTLVDLISGSVSFRAAYWWEVENRQYLAVDYEHELGGKAAVLAREAGESVPVSEPMFCRSSEEGFFRVLVGPMSKENWTQLDLFVIPPDSQSVFSLGTLRDARTDFSPPVYDTNGPSVATLFVDEVFGVPPVNERGNQWDVGLVGGPSAGRPDIRLEFKVGSGFRVLSPLHRDVVGSLRMSWSEELKGNPLRDTLMVRLLDDDFGGLLEDATMQNDEIGSAGWGPGRWPNGSAVVHLYPAGAVRLRLSWEPFFSEVPRASPLFARRGRPAGLPAYADHVRTGH